MLPPELPGRVSGGPGQAPIPAHKGGRPRAGAPPAAQMAAKQPAGSAAQQPPRRSGARTAEGQNLSHTEPATKPRGGNCGGNPGGANPWVAAPAPTQAPSDHQPTYEHPREQAGARGEKKAPGKRRRQRNTTLARLPAPQPPRP